MKSTTFSRGRPRVPVTFGRNSQRARKQVPKEHPPHTEPRCPIGRVQGPRQIPSKISQMNPGSGWEGSEAEWLWGMPRAAPTCRHHQVLHPKFRGLRKVTLAFVCSLSLVLE